MSSDKVQNNWLWQGTSTKHVLLAKAMQACWVDPPLCWKTWGTIRATAACPSRSWRLLCY